MGKGLALTLCDLMLSVSPMSFFFSCEITLNLSHQRDMQDALGNPTKDFLLPVRSIILSSKAIFPYLFVFLGTSQSFFILLKALKSLMK